MTDVDERDEVLREAYRSLRRETPVGGDVLVGVRATMRRRARSRRVTAAVAASACVAVVALAAISLGGDERGIDPQPAPTTGPTGGTVTQTAVPNEGVLVSARNVPGLELSDFTASCDEAEVLGETVTILVVRAEPLTADGGGADLRIQSEVGAIDPAVPIELPIAAAYEGTSRGPALFSVFAARWERVDNTREASSGQTGSVGTVSFARPVDCTPGSTVEVVIDATLGGEQPGQDLTVRGTVRAAVR